MAEGKDDGEDFAALLAEYEAGGQGAPRRRALQVGETVSGRVVSVGQDAVFIDLGGKAEGMIDAAEVRDDDGRLTVAVGDTVEGRVVDTGARTGCVVLRRTIRRGPEAKAELEQAFQLQIPVEGVVTAVNKGGVEVQLAGVRAFCPISQLDLKHVEDAAAYVGRRLPFRITRFEPAPRGRDPNLVVSRRVLLEEEAQARAEKTRATLQAGAVLRGTVTSLRDYGAFVDLGGIEGMLHVSEIGFSRVAHPREALAVGQTIEVQVLKIEKTGDPRRPEKVALSLKSLAQDPWEEAAARLAEGASARGVVTRVEPFGAFVEVAPGVEGLVHVSELSGGRPVKHAREVVKVGQTLDVTVLAVDRDRRRLSLGTTPRADADDADAGSYAPAPSGFGTLGDLLERGGKKK
jgi:small subunit ribosomal protein S1